MHKLSSRWAITFICMQSWRKVKMKVRLFVFCIIFLLIAFNSHCKLTVVCYWRISTDAAQMLNSGFRKQLYVSLVTTRRLSGLNKCAAWRCTVWLATVFYWAAFSFFLHKASFFCSCSVDFYWCKVWFKELKISTFCFSVCKHDWLLLLWNDHLSFLSLHLLHSVWFQVIPVCVRPGLWTERLVIIFPLPLLWGTLAEVILVSCRRHVTWCV